MESKAAVQFSAIIRKFSNFSEICEVQREPSRLHYIIPLLPPTVFNGLLDQVVEGISFP